MDTHVKTELLECTAGSDEDRLTFPQVVGRLLAVGVERYHADLIQSEKTYYLPTGSHETVRCHDLETAPATKFSAHQVERAVRASQAREITYREFCRRIAAAGCVGYFVSLTGKRAVYYGRTGETHVELFPSSS